MEDGRVRSTMARAIQVATNQYVPPRNPMVASRLTEANLWKISAAGLGQDAKK